MKQNYLFKFDEAQSKFGRAWDAIADCFDDFSEMYVERVGDSDRAFYAQVSNAHEPIVLDPVASIEALPIKFIMPGNDTEDLIDEDDADQRTISSTSFFTEEQLEWGEYMFDLAR